MNLEQKRQCLKLARTMAHLAKSNKYQRKWYLIRARKAMEKVKAETTRVLKLVA